MADITSNQYVPDYLVRPGEILEEYLEDLRQTKLLVPTRGEGSILTPGEEKLLKSLENLLD